MEQKEKKVVQIKLVRHKWPDEIAAEKQNKRRKLLLSMGAVLLFMLGFLSANAITKTKVSDSIGNQKLNEVYDVMMNRWYFGKDNDALGDELLDNALLGMTSSEEDPYTSYLTSKDALEMSSSLQGSISGIGIQYVYLNDSGKSYITDVFANGPADKAGLKAGDLLLAINGESVIGMDNDEMHQKILGSSGSKVSIQVKRENQILDYEMERNEVVNSVFGEINGTTGILSIRSFSENAGELCGEQFERFKKAGVTSLIIDLRGNGGGYLQAAEDIADYLLDKGSVVYCEENRDGSIEKGKTAGKAKHYAFETVVVLVDGGTASASEVLTAALSEHLHATVVGEHTFGKGTVQITQPFADGSALKYTIAQWLTPSQKKIHGKGIEPDVKVALDEAVSLSPIVLNNETFGADSVSNAAIYVQLQLRFLGYAVDRTDGYFSQTSSDQLKRYQAKVGLNANGVIDQDVMDSLYSSVQLKWEKERNVLDTQLLAAMEVANGRN